MEVKNMAVDPVCKMTVDEKTAEFKTEHEGETYYFCAGGCKNAFEETPEKYLGAQSGTAEPQEMPHSHGGKKPWWKFW